MDTVDKLPAAVDACLVGTTVTTLTDNGTRTHRSAVYDSDGGLQLGNRTGASLTVGGNVNFVTDNANDVGGNGTMRPRDVYVARQLILQGTAPRYGRTARWSTAPSPRLSVAQAQLARPRVRREGGCRSQ